MNIGPSSRISYWTISLHDFSTWHTCSHHFVVFADLVSHGVLHLESREMAEDLNFHKKRRVTRSSLTKLSTKVTELEANWSSPDTFYNAQNVASKLKTLDTEFRNHQLKIMDLAMSEEDLTEEQQALDDHDDIVS